MQVLSDDLDIDALTDHLAPHLLPGLFCTFTFRPPDGSLVGEHSLPFVKRTVRKLREELSRILGFSRRAVRKSGGLYGVVVYERHQSGAYHAHAVLSFPGMRSHPIGQLSPCPWIQALKDKCFERAGISRIYLVDTPGAVRYTLKYISKDPESWDFVGTFPDRDVAG